MLRKFECKTYGHNKVWSIDYDGRTDYSTVYIRWGKIGGSLQYTEKEMSRSAIEKLIREKLDKGYKEVGTAVVHTKPVPEAKADTKKMSKLLGNNHSLI